MTNRLTRTVISLMCLFFFVLCEVQLVHALPSSLLCWRSLGPDTGSQDTGLAMTHTTLTSTGPDEAWLAWEENGPKVHRWAKKQWWHVPMPVRSGAGPMRYPVVVAAPPWTAILAASANGKDGTSALHVACWQDNAWQWLGAPLLSSLKPFTHANDASIALVDDQPVVAWAEERHVKLVGLFASRWNGSSWLRLGTLTPEGDDYYLSPTMVVDAAKQIWLGWKEGRPGRVRVSRWDGVTWHDVGRASLQKISEKGGFVTEPSLAVDSKGQAWILWQSMEKPGGSSLVLARWEGTTWTEIPAPRAPEGKDETVWSAKMILRADLPVIAWSQADNTDNHRLFASQWAEGDRWIPLLTGLHLVEGVSNANDVRLATGDARSFFVSWDEAGKDGHRTRLVQAYPCGAGETPVAPPKSSVERDTWPTTVDEAAKQIAAELDADSKTRLRMTKKQELSQYHQGWGTGIRNSLGLWRGNEKLLKSCGKGKSVHPDECSAIIIEAVLDLFQDLPLKK